MEQSTVKNPHASTQNKANELSYQSAGVNINQGNDLVESIKPLAKETYSSHVLSSIGGFAGLYEVPSNYKNPVLVAATDGVGTKLKIAKAMNNHSTIGIDLVAMCANDIIVSGAKPHFFLDYYACGKLENEVALEVIKGIALACSDSGISLLGGETAEMPGIYQNKDYDLAGFCVGFAEKSQLVNPNSITEKDIIIGLSSSGVHSNGFSLIRKILEVNKLSLADKLNETETIGELLLRPTLLYQNPLCQLIADKKVKACAHITGGGLHENIQRVVPNNYNANFILQDYKIPEIFSFLQQTGNLSDAELWKTFNCGIGMTLIVAPENYEAVIQTYRDFNFSELNKTNAFHIGYIGKN